jgi:hypothetical protein
MAYRLTNDARYGKKIVDQLDSWARANPPLDDPETWRKTLPRWWLMDSAVRADTWVWTFSMLVDTDVWTPQINTLFLYKMCQHGDFLNVVTTQDIRTNHALVHGQGLLTLAKFFPEFVDSEKWAERGRDILYRAMDAQTFADGCNGEQSPNYAMVVTPRLLEMLWLDRQDGHDWPADRVALLRRAVESYYQLLSPDGNQPPLSDSYRTNPSTFFLLADIVLNETRYPPAKPRNRDVWVFGPKNIAKYLDAPLRPMAGERGRTYAMTASGNYVMRSGADEKARQIIFDAGPKGGLHGHYDLLNFELFGYDRPLIADPGLLRYDESDDRAWIRSTPAHNTISIDGQNHGELEGAGNPGIVVDQWDVQPDHVQVTAHHFGYGYLAGRPVVARSIWYDYDSTMLVVDWGEGVEPHEYTTSFTINGTAVSYDSAQGSIRSTNKIGGNVAIRPLPRPNQSTRTERRFTSSRPPPDEKDPATRFAVSQTGEFVTFATLVLAYEGQRAPATRAQLVSADIKPGEPVIIRLTKPDGTSRDITFTPPALQRLDETATTQGESADLAFDSTGRLHHVFFDKESRTLKYTVRGSNGRWSIVETIDAALGCGEHPSIAIDGNDHVGVAYTDANDADLKYAFHDGTEWQVQTVDAEGQTGYYPSLAFSRRSGAVISYYDKSRGDLRLATTVRHGWDLQTIDVGDVGTKDVGRFSQLALDPSRADASKWVIAYEDTGGGRYRYAVQGKIKNGQPKDEYTIFEIDTAATKLGGGTSLAFDANNRPFVSFYDARRDSIVCATSNRDTSSGPKFERSVVATGITAGDRTAVVLDASGRVNVLYFDPSKNAAMRATRADDGSWNSQPLAPGGREIHAARHGATLAFTTLDSSTGQMRVVVP